MHKFLCMFGWTASSAAADGDGLASADLMRPLLQVARLESSTVQSKLSDIKVEVPVKRGTSHGSVAGTSFTSRITLAEPACTRNVAMRKLTAFVWTTPLPAYLSYKKLLTRMAVMSAKSPRALRCSRRQMRCHQFGWEDRHSRLEVAVAGGTSEDSCCDSLPAKGRSLEASDDEGTCCKRCRMACA